MIQDILGHPSGKKSICIGPACVEGDLRPMAIRGRHKKSAKQRLGARSIHGGLYVRPKFPVLARSRLSEDLGAEGPFELVKLPTVLNLASLLLYVVRKSPGKATLVAGLSLRR